jgi:hypothetical protein
MSETEKKRFSARVRVGTLETMDDYADEENLNRSQAIERIVDQWEESHTQPDGAGGEGMLGALAALGERATLFGMILTPILLLFPLLAVPFVSSLSPTFQAALAGLWISLLVAKVVSALFTVLGLLALEAQYGIVEGAIGRTAAKLRGGAA